MGATERMVPMPKLGMTMTEGVLLHWHVAEGAVVAKDDVLAEVETDKVELEVESPVAGRIARLLAAEGATIPVGEPLLVIETESSSSRAVPASSPLAASPAPAAAASSASAVATLAGEATSPRVQVAATPAARRLAAERGLDLAALASAGNATPLRAADVLAHDAEATQATQAATVEEARQPALTPLARKLAEAHGLAAADLATAGGEATRRLDRQAVEGLVAARVQGTDIGVNGNGHAHTLAPVAATPASQSASPIPSLDDSEERVALTPMRRTIAERTTRSFTTTPHIYLDTEADMTQAEALRLAHAAQAQRAGMRAPSATALLVRVVAVALRRHPEVNAGFVAARDGQPAAIRRWRGVNVGVAVALPDGLLVPVVRDADRKSLREIADDLTDLAERARSGKLLPDDLAGGTFSISNLGMYGIDTFHAVLNEPQAAILAVGKTTKRAVVLEGADGEDTIAIRPMLKLSLSADHRVLDGASGARFMATLRELLEEPRLLV